MPKFVEQIYTPRISTSVDYALQTELKLNLPTVSVKIGYKYFCLLYTSDAADELLCVDLGGRRIIKEKNKTQTHTTAEKHSAR